MNISAVTQNPAAYTVKSGNDYPRNESAHIDEATKNTETSSKKIDLQNVSINEVSALIKSGKTELLGVVPFIPPHVLEQYNYDPELIGEHRVDLLGQVEKSIDFRKSIGGNTDYLQTVLDKLMKINGAEFTEKIDVIA